jgi:hypothetical protein
LDDIEWKHDNDNEASKNKMVLAKRSIQKGKPIASVPLYAIQRLHTNKGTSCSSTAAADQEECDAMDSMYHEGCYGQVGSSLQLCPLSHGPIRVVILSTSSNTEEAVVDNDNNNEKPNAKYQWSAWNDDNKKRSKLSPLEITKVRTNERMNEEMNQSPPLMLHVWRNDGQGTYNFFFSFLFY